jgi:hypothetical protein
LASQGRNLEGGTGMPLMVTGSFTATRFTRSLPVCMYAPRVKSGYDRVRDVLTSRQTPSISVPPMPFAPAIRVMMPPHTVASGRPPFSIVTTAPAGTSSRKSPTVPRVAPAGS